MLTFTTNGRSLMVKIADPKGELYAGMIAGAMALNTGGGGWGLDYVTCDTYVPEADQPGGGTCQDEWVIQEKHQDGGTGLVKAILNLRAFIGSQRGVGQVTTDAFKTEVDRRLREEGQSPYFTV